MSIQVGDLVQVLRSSKTVEKGEMGILCDRWAAQPGFDERTIWTVQLLNGQQFRYLAKDLKKIN